MEQAIKKEKQYRIIDWCWLICILSFVGFLVENIWNIFTSGRVDNRNMHLPFILGYGLAILGIYLFFGTPTDNHGLINLSYKSNKVFLYVSYTILVTIFVCINELIIGNAMEYLSHIHYWDFSDVPLHITRYTSILTAIAYSTLITLFMSLLFDKMMTWLNGFSDNMYRIIGFTLIILLILDLFISFDTMIKNKDFNLIWHIELFKKGS